MLSRPGRLQHALAHGSLLVVLGSLDARCGGSPGAPGFGPLAASGASAVALGAVIPPNGSTVPYGVRTLVTVNYRVAGSPSGAVLVFSCLSRVNVSGGFLADTCDGTAATDALGRVENHPYLPPYYQAQGISDIKFIVNRMVIDSVDGTVLATQVVPWVWNFN